MDSLEKEKFGGNVVKTLGPEAYHLQTGIDSSNAFCYSKLGYGKCSILLNHLACDVFKDSIYCPT